MKKTILNKLSLLLVVMLFAAAAFGCGNKATQKTETTAQTQESDVTVLGEESAANVFALTVVDKDGNSTAYEVHTNEENVGQALFALEFINDASFFDTVNGMTASWDEDKAYWAVYVGEEYASVGVGEMTFTEGEKMELSFVYTAE